jgi:hypothetical protein
MYICLYMYIDYIKGGYHKGSRALALAPLTRFRYSLGWRMNGLDFEKR